MRKIFTKLFGLALLVCLFSVTTEVYAQCDVDLSTSNVELVTDPTTVCDSADLLYRVVGFPGAQYAFNFDGNIAGGFTSDSTIAVPEGIAFTVQVLVDDTCYSDVLPVTNASIVEPVEILEPGVENPLCYGASGEITINFNGKGGAYTYYVVPEADWADLAPAPVADPENYVVPSSQVIRPSGTYYVAVSDAANCVDLSDIASWDTAVVMPAPDQLVVDTIYGEDPACIGSNGTITVVVSGGTPNTDGSYDVTVGGLTYATVNDTAIFGLPAGVDYQATVVDSFGCQAVSDSLITLVDPEEIVFDIDITDVDCADTLNGAITVMITAPDTGLYAVSLGDGMWIQDNDANDASPEPDTITIDGLSASEYYSLFVRNVNTICDSVAYSNPNNTGNIISVQQPDSLAFAVVFDTIQCEGGVGTISVSDFDGGSGDFFVSLNSDGGSEVKAPEYAIASDVVEWTDIPAGTYAVVVRDTNAVSDCASTSEFVVMIEPSSVIITDIDSIKPTCPGGNDGIINITAEGGNGTIEYSIDSVMWYANNIFTVEAGMYTVHARDPLCKDQVVSEMVSVGALAPNTISIVKNDTVNECAGTNDNDVRVYVGPWASQAGEHRFVTVYYSDDMSDVYVNNTDTVPFGDHGAPGAYFEAVDMDPGTYYFWAIDNFGCIADNDVDGTGDYVKVTILENDEFKVVGEVTEHASCYGDKDGVITIKGSGGGEGDYYYGVANTMAAAQAMSLGAMTAWPVDADSVEVQVGKGTYYVVGYDDHCGNKAYDGPFVVDGYEMVTIRDTAMSVTDIVCAGDSTGVIEVFAAEGGTEEGYTYTLQVWDEGVYVDVDGYIDVEETVYENLPWGTYRVVVTDKGGCDGAMTGDIDVDGPTEEVVIDDYNVWPISCNGSADGRIDIYAAGGTAPYWFKVGTNNWREFPEDSDYRPIVITAAGEYEVWVKDSKGCVSESEIFIIEEPSPLVIDYSKKDVTDACDADNGELTIKPSGSVPGDVPWGNDYDVYVNDVQYASHLDAPDSVVLTGLTAGEYEIMVETNHGAGLVNSCVAYETVTIYAPDTVSAVAEVTQNVLCNGGNNGEIVISEMSGGTVAGMYNVTINPAVGTKDTVDGTIVFGELTAQDYDVTIEDDEGCSYTIFNIKVDEPTALALGTTHIQDITCAEEGKFSVQATGGAGDYKYYAELSILPAHILVPGPDSEKWQSDSIFSVSKAGTYIVWAMDVNGCEIGGEEDALDNPVNAWRVKVEKPEIVVDVWGTATDEGEVACKGDMTAGVYLTEVQINGEVVGDSVYTVTINDVATDSLGTLGAGKHVIKVTHESGCVGTDTVEVSEPELALDVTLEVAEGEFTCPDVVEGYIEATATGGWESFGPPAVEQKSASLQEPGGYMYQLWRDGVLLTDYQPVNSFLVQINHTYQVVVSDGYCTDTSNVIVIDPVAPVELVDLMDVTCSSDTLASVKVTATAEGDRQVYVKWTQFEAESGIESDSTVLMDQGEIVLSQMFKFDNENVEDIHYEFQVIDEKGCRSAIDTMTFDQVISAPLELTVAEGETGDCTTEVTVTAAGGVAPYTVMVNGEETTETVLMLGGGTYLISVMDAHECEVSEEITLEYGTSADTAIETYTGEAVQFVVEAADLDTMLYAGVYSFYYDIATDCTAELNVTVTEKDRAMPVLDTVTPQDTIADNHAIFTIVFEDVVTFNDSVMGNLTVTAKDSAEATLVIPITSDMVDGNTITVDYDYTVVGKLDLNTTYVVAVDSGIVMGDGLAWDGATGDWMFTTGDDWATPVIDVETDEQFKVYPNPFNDRIKIENYDKLTRVVLTNIAGQRVLDINSPTEEIRTGNLVTGVYVITLISNDEIVKSERIIKR